MITLEQAKALKRGEYIHVDGCNITKGPKGGNVKRHVKAWRVSGMVKLWKRDPKRIDIPLAYDLYTHTHINEYDLPHCHLASECPLKEEVASV